MHRIDWNLLIKNGGVHVLLRARKLMNELWGAAYIILAWFPTVLHCSRHNSGNTLCTDTSLSVFDTDNHFPWRSSGSLYPRDNNIDSCYTKYRPSVLWGCVSVVCVWYYYIACMGFHTIPLRRPHYPYNGNPNTWKDGLERALDSGCKS